MAEMIEKKKEERERNIILIISLKIDLKYINNSYYFILLILSYKKKIYIFNCLFIISILFRNKTY